MKATNTAAGGIWVRADPTTRPMFPQSHACYNVIDGRHRNRGRYRDGHRDRDGYGDRYRDRHRDRDSFEILLLLTLQPHNLAHPQPFSDGEVGESPFGFPRAA